MNVPTGDAGTRVRSPVPRPRADDDAWVHAAAVVHDDGQLVAVAAGFLRQGLDSDDMTVLGCRPPVRGLVLDALGDRAGSVIVDDRVCLYAERAPEVFAHANRLLEQAAGQGSGRLRILAQADFGDDPRDVREGQCFEAASNVLRPPTPMATLCLYDARRLPDALVRSARATHPFLLDGGAQRVNSDFVEPVPFVRGLPVPREPVEDGVPVLAIDDASSLSGLRHAIGAVLESVVPDRDQREDLHLALSELAANAFRHGGRPVSSRLWASGERLVGTITDGGTGIADPLYGYWPAHGEDLGQGGMGLWLARKLCDHVDLLPGPDGPTVRVNTALR